MDNKKVKYCHRRQRVLMKGYLFVGLLGMVFNAVGFNASDTVPINVTGTIYASSCTVTFPGDIDLGTYYRQNISVAGGNTPEVIVTVNLTGCSPFITKATASFSGTPYAEDSSYGPYIYANNVADGAHDLGLQLFNNDPVVSLGNNTSYVLNIDATTQSAALVMAARMYTPTVRRQRVILVQQLPLILPMTSVK
ncbi:fimbrial protein [Limnobaculum zhutongyuii]|uniref:fimbrial protein SthD n=1 Tax=Limnobaculum zhutongyuii TaxID=2498113 RepID=UPI001FEC4A08|nr:fimbrial protein SthD [Limnobaculum zhutongyuii]